MYTANKNQAPQMITYYRPKCVTLRKTRLARPVD